MTEQSHCSESLQLQTVIPHIRIIGVIEGRPPEDLGRFSSFAVPRVGENICIQYWRAPVFQVDWTNIKGRPRVQVFVDLTEVEQKFNKSI